MTLPGPGRPGGETIDVVLPVLDEAEAIPWVLSRLPEGCRAIIVDNGSTDGSAEIARSLGATVVEESRRGFGAACFAGLTAARTELVAFMDCDASLDPRDLTRLIEPVGSGRADLVLGSRSPDRGAWPVHARVANRYLAHQVGRRTGVALRDLGPMRVARRQPLLDLGLADRRSGWPLEMVLRAAAAGWRIEERPVRYRARAGRSKVTGTVAGTVTAVRDMRARLREAETYGAAVRRDVDPPPEELR
jgi:glycosyltransferase involved in cell wall biosynthesis